MTRAIAAGFAGLLLVSAVPAWAQMTNPAQLTSPAMGGAKAKSNQERNAAPIPPPALPGARAEPNSVAPASRAAADLPPTEALFDAINRGDLATAKDAVSRGADLNGTNVLGLTPLDLSIDLGRNQISFFLLSLRGATGFNSAGGPPPAASPDAQQPTRAEKLAAERANRVARQQASAREAAPVAPRTARLFAGDGGSPVPQAGFLGFGSGR